MKRILLGNAAVALGAYMANVTVATGYPGTPSTEILERFARYPDVYSEWSPNEKVALEVGVGASLAGARVLVTMKHVGLNVAADPFFAAAYMGVEGGLVIVSADDPGMHSSQGEQDNRNYAKFAKVPLLEPSNSQECVDMMRIGMEISETYDTPVLLRSTTRVSHAQSLVDVDADQIQRPKQRPPLPFNRHPEKFVMLPAHARKQRVALKYRLERLQEYVETTPLNRVEWGDKKLGIITHSMSYQYAREVFPQASFLKLGMAYPLPKKLIVDFASQVETLLIIEELDPYLQEQILALPDLPDVPVLGKEVFPEIGEFNPQLLARCALEHGLLSPEDIPFPLPEEEEETPELIDIPGRPPLLCPGCGHRGTFYILRQLMYPDGSDITLTPKTANNPYQRANIAQRRQYGIVVNGDIGCYTLGALQPLFAMDTCGCMGASITYALGMEKAGIKNKVVAVIGDSTFYHSGITGLVDVITSGAATTVIILDNFTTAMTGGNVNPGTGTTLDGQPARRVELETLCKGLGVEDVQVINAFDNDAIERELNRSLQSSEPSVLIVRAPCVLQERASYPQVSWVEPEKCVSCWACLVTACPALIRQDDKVAIIPDMCTDCEVCNQVCPYDAIFRVERAAVSV
ncbi:MAG: indolepyruvate ferredoxin oxidoreductase subunit alpha [Proteobacteria bacterium]|nr:indolepyruvate ferredoxin oxidoreductase subunit alpha [Pseudomonadota bacterium]